MIKATFELLDDDQLSLPILDQPPVVNVRITTPDKTIEGELDSKTKTLGDLPIK